jgi:hypothetical protein
MRLSSYGSSGFNLYSPADAEDERVACRVEAAQVESERHILKPGLMFKGKGLKPVAFKLWVNNRVQRAPPHHVEGSAAVV